MVILGIADGPDASASLVMDGKLVAMAYQERLDRTPRSRTFPWAAIDEVLAIAGLHKENVDLVAVAGRFSPPFFLRRHPNLRRFARDAFSAAHDAQVLVQAVMKQSGLGALEADRAADWLTELLRAKGLHMERVVLVDTHRALAAAAYRCQPRADVLIFTLHPRGDGGAVAVHRGVAGHLDRDWTQSGFSSLHTHLQRCATALGFDPLTEMDLMWAQAATGEPDPELLRLLSKDLSSDGPGLGQRAYPLPRWRQEPLYQQLERCGPAAGAASVLENLQRAVADLVRHHLAAQDLKDVVLAGAVFDNPRLVAAVANLPEVRSVSCEPFGGYPSLSVGAATLVGGTSPHVMETALGRVHQEDPIARALSAAGVAAQTPPDLPGAIAGLLASGKAVARFALRDGVGRQGLGRRSVLVRADDPGAVQAARVALGRPDLEEVACAYLPTPSDGHVQGREKLEYTLRFGNVAPRVDERFGRRYPGVVLPDGRAHLQRVDPGDDAVLHEALTALHADTGCAAVAVLPLANDRDPLVSLPAEALRVWRRSGLAALVLGERLVLPA